MGLAVAVGVFINARMGTPAAGAFVAAAFPGTTAPDWLEIPIGNKRLIRHRTITHWLVLWVALLAAALWHAQAAPLAGMALAGFAFGGLTHWLGDFGTPMGVPVLNPARRRSMDIWATGRGEFSPIALAWFLAAFLLIEVRH